MHVVGMSLTSLTTEVLAAFVAGICVGFALSKLKMINFTRFSTVKEVPETWFASHEHLSGKVMAVSDGDTFRLRHTPLFRGTGDDDGKLTETTLQIRLAGVDAPEMPHFGKECQPYAKEAKAWLKSLLLDKTVTVKLLRRDQYGRAVCTVLLGTWPFQKDVSAELLKAGLGRVYRLSGAEYDGKLELFNALEADAKRRRVNIWQDA